MPGASISVIARSEATKQSKLYPRRHILNCLATLAMTAWINPPPSTDIQFPSR
jgi:hypothetical protein